MARVGPGAECVEDRVVGPDVEVVRCRAVLVPRPEEFTGNAGPELGAEFPGYDICAVVERAADLIGDDAELADDQRLVEVVALLDPALEAVPLVAWDQMVVVVVVVLAEVEGGDAHHGLVVGVLRAALAAADCPQRDEVVRVDRLDQPRDVARERGEDALRGRLGDGRAVSAFVGQDFRLVDKLPGENRRVILVAGDDLGNPVAVGDGP